MVISPFNISQIAFLGTNENITFVIRKLFTWFQDAHFQYAPAPGPCASIESCCLILSIRRCNCFDSSIYPKAIIYDMIEQYAHQNAYPDQDESYDEGDLVLIFYFHQIFPSLDLPINPLF